MPQNRFEEWPQLLQDGMRHLQYKLVEEEAKVGFFRTFNPNIMPGLLQTPEYARACLNQGLVTAGAPDDLDEAVQARMRRQEILHREDKRFHFVLTEACLRLRYCPAKGMLDQLNRLVASLALPNLKLGVIEFTTVYPVGPWHDFWLRDNDNVAVETFSGELHITTPEEVEVYAKVFESLAGVASYDEAARQIITRAIDDLSRETG